MTIEEMSKGLKLSIQAALENKTDLCAAGGVTH